jgi:acyl-CoA thioesterase-1
MSGPDVRVCFLGDSYILGQGDDSGLGWTGRVHAAERGRGLDLSSYNLGVRGQTGTQIAERAACEIGVRIAERGDRQGVVAAFGANDVRLDRPFQESVTAMQGILRWAASQRYQAFVLGLTPSAEAEIDDVRIRLSRELAQAARDLAAPFLDIRAAVADWSAWHREAAQGDGVHPNAEGYRRVAEAFLAWKPWRDWLDR